MEQFPGNFGHPHSRVGKMMQKRLFCEGDDAYDMQFLSCRFCVKFVDSMLRFLHDQSVYVVRLSDVF